MKPHLLLSLLILGAIGMMLPLSQCKKAEQQHRPQRVAYEAIPASLADSFSGDRAFKHVENIVAFGPRPPASPGFEKTLAYLEERLAEYAWTTTRQNFRAATPEGPVDFTNLIARHDSAPRHPESVPVIIGGHIDSKKLPFPFVGANDGGSSTGVLLELARVLSTDPSSASRVELVFFDGEEAFRPNITANDGLYGSKYFAHDISTRTSWPAFGIVLDIVGDPKFSLYHNPETPAPFADAVMRVAETLDFEKGLRVAPGPIVDDHIPLQNTGLPCLHLIGDFTTMDYWHQPGDTLDRVSPGMLDKVGKLTLRFLSEARPPDPD